ncbi:hypothetical protein ACHAWU_002045 [Discostella pseudostelligera]|uniref:Uncharacterized protein n=1 Tax=Discostella pseudostelligera TaxID=259834 RepID=A0ABD3M942_9STRA
MRDVTQRMMVQLLTDVSRRSSSGTDHERIDSEAREEGILYGLDCLHADAVDTAEHRFADGAESIVSEESDQNDIPLQEQVDSRLYILRETASGQQIWKRSMREESDVIASHIAANCRASFRVGCHSYRSMLPPIVGDQPPVRSRRWLRNCSRGVLQSYLLSRSPSHDGQSYRLRFPEHVYCWFADGNDDLSADDNRWAFYHGLKSLIDIDPEYWLMYNLLDGMQGEGFASFVVTTFEAIQKQTGTSLNERFGTEFSCTQAIASKSQLMNAFCDSIQHELFEGLSTTVTELMAKDNRTSDLRSNEVESSSIDLFSFVQCMMKTYLSQRKKRTTLLRLMFETASQGVLTDSYDAKGSNSMSKRDLVSVSQLFEILKTLWKDVTLEETVMIFREAYDAMYPPPQWGKTAPDGINFECFLIAVERLNALSRAVVVNI